MAFVSPNPASRISRVFLRIGIAAKKVLILRMAVPSVRTIRQFYLLALPVTIDPKLQFVVMVQCAVNVGPEFLKNVPSDV